MLNASGLPRTLKVCPRASVLCVVVFGWYRARISLSACCAAGARGMLGGRSRPSCPPPMVSSLDYGEDLPTWHSAMVGGW